MGIVFLEFILADSLTNPLGLASNPSRTPTSLPSMQIPITAAASPSSQFQTGKIYYAAFVKKTNFAARHPVYIDAKSMCQDRIYQT